MRIFKKVPAILVLVCCLTACTGSRFGIQRHPAEKMPDLPSRTIQLENVLAPREGLEAVEYSFDFPIKRLFFHTEGNQVLIIGTNKKNNAKENPLIMLNMPGFEPAWHAKTLAPYFKVFIPKKVPEIIVFAGPRQLFGVSSSTGEIVWQRPGNNITQGFSEHLAFGKREVNVGTDEKMTTKTQLQFFDVRDGKTLWERGYCDTDIWNRSVQIHQEKTLILYGDGLHSYDLKNGEGWSCEVDSHAIGGVGAVVAGQILSALAGVPSGTRIDHYTGLHSNVLISGDKIYYAGNRVLVCLNLETGKEIWNVDLPQVAAHSGLMEEDGHLLMIGFGWCYKNNVITDYSTPFVARFDKSSGAQLLYQDVGLKSRVNDHIITQDGYGLVCGGEFILVDKRNPATIIRPDGPGNHSNDAGAKALGMIKNLKNYYFLENGQFISLATLEDETSIWLNTGDAFIQYGPDLTVRRRFPKTGLFSQLYTNESLVLIRGITPATPKTQPDGHQNIKVLDAGSDGKNLLADIKTAYACQIVADSLILWDHTIFTDKVIVLPLNKLAMP